MNTGHFTKVFDVAETGFREWSFPAFGLIFVTIGIVIFFFPNIVSSLGIAYFDFKSRRARVFRYFFLGFAIVWTVLASIATYLPYERHAAMARDNTCRTVEGPVQNFTPMPASGHGYESFSVSGVPFQYSDSVLKGSGFNTTASQGGPINASSHVRICFDPSENVILRLEILNFQGPPKEYGGSLKLFPDISQKPGSTLPTPIGSVQWYGNIFILLWVLDVAGIVLLFIPYLRTYFKIGSIQMGEARNAISLADGEKAKLRNTVIVRDEAGAAIWVRPRGFNLLQVPLMVAKINTDAVGTLVDGEIRFSSGFPVTMAVFFWSAYRFFAADMAKDTNSPLSAEQFVGIAALLFLIVGIVNLRSRRARMQTLVQRALSELSRTSGAPS